MESQGIGRPPIPPRKSYGPVESSETPPPIPPLPVAYRDSEHAAFFQVSDARRRSAPVGRTKRKLNPAYSSPEVISSLIDSFSTLSRSDPDSGQLSQTHGAPFTPATPAMGPRTSFAATTDSSRNSLSDYDLYRQQLADEVEEPDAAEPPVVRTSKRPSGRSEWSAPRIQHESGLGTYFRNAYTRSTSSLASSLRGDDDAKSIGNLSIESTRRRRSLVTASRESLEIRKGRKMVPSNMMSPPRSELGTLQAGSTLETVHGASGALDNMTPPISPKRRAPLGSVIHEEPPSLGFITGVSKSASIPNSIKEGKKPMTNDANGPSVPSRRSSLRHTDQANAGRNRLSREVNVHALSTFVDEEDEPQTKVILTSLDGEPTEVTKRIQDLKARKEQREREAREPPDFNTHIQKTSTLSLPGMVPASNRASPQHDAENYTEKNTEKKNRIAQLESINVPPRRASASPARVGTNIATTTPASKEHLNHLGIPPQPATPLTPTPLPINYSYVLRTLNKRDSLSDVKAVTSDKDDNRRPLGVGGRSAVARSSVPRSTTLDPSTLASSKFGLSEALDGRPAADAGTKCEKSSRSNSLKLNRRRWSQPEISAAPGRNSSTGNPEPLAVQPPLRQDKILEERPSSADSINNDINRFLHHPRLSQKIRHPHSGRTIAFSEVGDPMGHAVFCCVGMGLTRYVMTFYDELATTLRLRLITPDRPGVGGSATDSNGTPLSWPDDVLAICQALHISKFSIMAHSAGAIYALATALRMPQHIRGRVHLLAPWIPPSQMLPIGLTQQDHPPAAQLPKSQRFLRVMPAPFLKIANTGFLSAASASLSPYGTGSPRKERRKKSTSSNNTPKKAVGKDSNMSQQSDTKTENVLSRPAAHTRRESILLMDQQDMPDGSTLEYVKSTRDLRSDYNKSRVQSDTFDQRQQVLDMEEEIERREIYDSRLTLSIWALATTNANPAVDLLVCLERQRDIGFMYKDITRAVIIHHGSKDTRVPVENVKWLGRTMRKCEVRVLEGEGHGLMASAAVMGSVLEEMAAEWDLWDDAIKKGGNTKRL